METKDTLSSCSYSDEQDMQQMLKQAKILKGTMFLNMDQLEKQLDKEEFQEIGSTASFKVLETQFQMFIKSRIYLDDEYVDMNTQQILHYTRLEFQNSGHTDSSNGIWNDAQADDAYMRPIYDEEPMAEVQTTAEINIFATGQQHTEQLEFNNEGEVDQHAEQCHDTCPLPANSVMPSARSQSTTNGSKPKPRINNQKSRNWPASKSSCVTTKTVPIAEHSRNSRSFSDSKHFVCSTCQKCVFNANHDYLNEVNLRAKVPSYKTTKRYKLVEPSARSERH
ncbi:hypothetical protein Tco_0704404 [Tanacetum coccineum]|uniref:Uncharacterized protein n=1 Tax=Tanacetum coccineum TaxID=301880 RepID=A0ABQ4Y1L6_9ASTR